MSSQYLLEEQRSALPASWRFAFGVMAGAAVVMVGCLASELAPQATSLFVAPAMTTRPMAVGMPSSPVWRSAFEVSGPSSLPTRARHIFFVRCCVGGITLRTRVCTATTGAAKNVLFPSECLPGSN